MKNRPGVLRASLNVMRAAVVAAGAALPCLPFLLRGVVSAMRQGFGGHVEKPAMPQKPDGEKS